MCKGNNSTTQTTGPNGAAMGAYQDLLSRAGNVANTPYQSYNGEFVAPINEQQQTGIGGINANAGFAQPYIQQAAGYANQAATPISGADIARYQSPYTQQVVDATMRQFNNQNAQQQQQVVGNAAAQGALGGDRVGVAQANLAGQQQMAEAPVIAGLYNQGYGQASQMALSQQQNLGQAAYSLGNLGVAGQNAALTGAGAQLGAGGLEQQTQQSQDAARFQEFMRQQAYPFQTTQWLAGLDTGVGSQMGGTSTTTPPKPNPWNTALGLGMTAASFFNKGGRIRGFDNGGGIGDSPWSGASGYVPGVKITGGAGAPKPPGSPAQQQQPGLGAYGQAGTGLHNLWNKYGPSNSPMDLTGGGFSPDGVGSLEGIGSAPESGFGMGPIYRDGGIVNLPQHDRIELRRGFDDGGSVAQAGFGTGSIIPDSFDDRFYVPPRPVDPAAYNLLQDAHAGGPDYDNTGNAAPHMADIPPPRPRPGVGADSDGGDLPPMITKGTNTAGVGAPDDLGPDTMAFSDRRAPGAAPDLPDAPPDAPAQSARQSGFGGLGLLNLSPNVRQGLLAAGLGMMASHSPFLGQAIGEGGIQGLGAYNAAQKQDLSAKKTEADIEHGRKQLEQAATNAANNLKLHTAQLEETKRQHTTMTPYQQAEVDQRKAALEETRRQHQLALKTPVTIDYDPRTGNPIMAFPRLNDKNEMEYRLRDGTVVNPFGSTPTPAAPGPQSDNGSPPVRTASLETGTATDAPRPGEGTVQYNTRVAQAGSYDYGTDAPYIEKGMDVPEPAPLAGRSVQSLKTDAENYLTTSKLPPVARGNSPVARVQQSYQNAVRNYAGALAQSRGMSPAEVADAWRTAPGMLRFVLGADGRSTVSLGTAVRHLDTMQQLTDAWQKGSTVGDWRTWNQVTSAVRREFGDAAVTNLQAAAKIIGPEIIKAIGVAGAGGERERESVEKIFSPSSTPDEIKGAIGTVQSLLGGQLEGRKRQAENAGVSEARFKSLIGDRPYEILTHTDKGGAPAGGTAASPEKAAAMDWLSKNPNDPRAAAIKKKLGIQ